MIAAVVAVLATLFIVRLWTSITISAVHNFGTKAATYDCARDEQDRRAPTYTSVTDHKAGR